MPSELTIFDEARAIPDPAARAAYLDHACGADADLRRRVTGLLAADAAADGAGFLDPPTEDRTGTFDGPAPTTVPAAGAAQAAGTVVGGRYKLLEPVGEGGMGAVWVAQQTDPVRRLVAVKLVKPGMDSRAVLARFDAERQALALMDHPNIAKVFDAGATDGGRPFFVMELVKGVPITHYCDARRLSVRDRLTLFSDVCRAVQHAHQKGVIHRDIKPSNVLVAPYDDRAVVKVIDFGVAKATGEPLTADTLYTGLGAVVGTPAYMAPEQATLNNLDVDTRADVYGLGALLYELLAGSPPFPQAELRRVGLLEMLRVVREVDPPRPSARVSTADGRPSIAAVRGTEPGALARLLRTDLDWVVMKALEKERGRRYDTAAGFAADVERYLAGEAVHAHPPGGGYRLRKFARRNRRAVAAGLVLAVAVAAGVGGAVRAEGQRVRAAEQSATQARVLTGKLRRLLDAANPANGGSPEVTLRGLLDAQTPTLFDGLEDQPEVEAELLATVGRTYATLIEPDRAIEHLERATDLRRTRLASDPAEQGRLLNDLAETYLNSPADRPADPAVQRGRAERAVAAAREAVDLHRQAGGLTGLIDALFTYDTALNAQTAFRGAAANPGATHDLHRQMIDAAGRLAAGPERDRYVAWAEVFRLGELGRRGDRAAAFRAARDAVPLWAAQYGDSHLFTARARVGLGTRYMDDRDYPAAEDQLRRAVAGYQDIFKGKPNPYEAAAARHLVAALAWQYKDARVKELLGKYPPAMRDQGGLSVWAARAPYQWGVLCLERGDYADAEKHLSAALEASQLHPANDGLAEDARYMLHGAVLWQGKFDDAAKAVEPWLGDARQASADNSRPLNLRSMQGVDPHVLYAQVLCVSGLRNTDDARRGKALLDDGAKRRPAGSPPPLLHRAVRAYCDFELGDPGPVVRDLPAILGVVPPWELHAHRSVEQVLVQALGRVNDPAEAVAVRRRGVDRAEKGLPPGHPETAARRVLLADALAKLAPRDPAEELKHLHRAYEEYTAHPEATRSLLGRRAAVVDRLVEVYTHAKDAKNIDKWREVRAGPFLGVASYPRPVPFPFPDRSP